MKWQKSALCGSILERGLVFFTELKLNDNVFAWLIVR